MIPYQIKGNYHKLALKGGIIGISVEWNCDLDWNFMEYCLPKYHFFLLDDNGWNFRFGKYHEENHRTLTKAYGIKFIVTATGSAGKFNLTNTIIILGNCFGLIGLANMAYDFIVLHCSSDLREQLLDHKYETVDETDTKKLLRHSMMAITTIGVLPDHYENKIQEEKKLKEEEEELKAEEERRRRRKTSIEIFEKYGAKDLIHQIWPDEHKSEEAKPKTLCSMDESLGRVERLI